MNFQPLSNYAVIEPVEVPDTTPSGLVLPESSKDKPNQGKVVAVGIGQRDMNGNLIPMTIVEGDTVIFPKFSGTEMKLNGTKYLIMRESDLFGIAK